MRRIRALLSGLRLDAGKKEDRIILSVVNNLFSVSLISLMTVLVGSILDSLVISNFLSETAFAAFGQNGDRITTFAPADENGRAMSARNPA